LPEQGGDGLLQDGTSEGACRCTDDRDADLNGCQEPLRIFSQAQR
jgi:hypothetical protein